MEFILKSLYFFLPAYLANMAPVLVRKIPFLAYPVNKKIFGQNKTWRGLIAACLAGLLAFWVQKILFIGGFRSLALIEYSDFSLALGFFLGAGAILGDLVKSYYKRKQNIPPGKPWLVFDQIDFVIGGILGSMFVYVPSASVVVVLLIASPLLHVVVNYAGFLLGIRKEKY